MQMRLTWVHVLLVIPLLYAIGCNHTPSTQTLPRQSLDGPYIAIQRRLDLLYARKQNLIKLPQDTLIQNLYSRYDSYRDFLERSEETIKNAYFNVIYPNGFIRPKSEEYNLETFNYIYNNMYFHHNNFNNVQKKLLGKYKSKKISDNDTLDLAPYYKRNLYDANKIDTLYHKFQTDKDDHFRLRLLQFVQIEKLRLSILYYNTLSALHLKITKEYKEW